MPFTGAAIVPHSPLLLPTVGREYATHTKRTHRALESLRRELYARAPDVVLVLHPHGTPVPGSFSLAVADRFEVGFKEFGDLVTVSTWPGSLSLAHHLKERAEDHGFPLLLNHQPMLPYDVGVPLTLLGTELKRTAIVPISTSTLDSQAHVSFGRMIAEELQRQSARVIVLASAELSHHVTDVAPGGGRPEGAQFDRAIVRSLHRRPWFEQLLKADPLMTELAEPCGYQVLLMLAGMIHRANVGIKKLAYESPFGIGLLTASLEVA